MSEQFADLKQRLFSQMSRGEPVLFLGAGFSLGASNQSGLKLPTSRELTQELWHLAFPGEEFDQTTTLGDAFHCARVRGLEPLRRLLQERLAVNSDTLPDYYRTWFSMPWHKCYTLNIDDLEMAAMRRFSLPRQLKSISAINDATTQTRGVSLQVIHLNGSLSDSVSQLTFSEPDYGERLTTPDTWLTHSSVDILSRPIVYVGTELHEPTLWQYVEYRKHKGGYSARELRPGSYLITPELSKARAMLLKELNVDWIPMTAQEFAESWLSDLKEAAEIGIKAISAIHSEEERRSTPQLVSEIVAQELPKQTEYLQGQEPTWWDLQSGKAIVRNCDTEIYGIASASLDSSEFTSPFLLSGTAGSGKSTALMRLALRLNSDGVPVYWIDESSSIEPYKLRQSIIQSEQPIAVLVDDADLWGRHLTSWAIELPKARRGVLFGAALRSSRIDGLMDSSSLGGIEPIEFSMPNLADTDIESLVEVLDKENRLGILKGKSDEERFKAFEEQAGRQLLVGMIQATSGQKLTQKIYKEFEELEEKQRFLYGAICLVSSQRYSIDRDELLLASGDPANETLNALEHLCQRHLVVRRNIHTGYGARHRLIAEELIRGAEFRQWIESVLKGIVFAFATTVTLDLPRAHRRWRRLIRFMNHDYLMRVVNLEAARSIYEGIESVLHWDHHYWLQRGSLEVESGDLALATNFLNQARSLTSGDRFVETEYAYLLMKKAAVSPYATDAVEMFNKGYDALQDLIRAYGKQDRYPFHVLGSQVMAWTRHAPMPASEKGRLLQSALSLVKEGVRLHPRADELQRLEKDIQKAWLMTAVPGQGPTS